MSKYMMVGTALFVVPRDAEEDSDTYWDRAWHASKAYSPGADKRDLMDAAVRAAMVKRGASYDAAAGK